MSHAFAFRQFTTDDGGPGLDSPESAGVAVHHRER
jgi:hypothetical protein